MAENGKAEREEIKKAIGRVTRQYRTERELSMQAFANAIGQVLKDGLTRQCVWNWEHAISTPEYWLLVELVLKTRDWRMDFAGDVLAILNPKSYEPVSAAGRKAVSSLEARTLPQGEQPLAPTSDQPVLQDEQPVLQGNPPVAPTEESRTEEQL